MRLSRRLMMSAQMVTPGSRVADVGCDHAHTSIWLVRSGIAKSCIAMDLREGPLKHAAENIAMYGCGDSITTRLSDGILELKPGEADCILITGMGGGLMTRILQMGQETAESACELVLQPQSDPGAVRRCVHELGFMIDRETCCMDYGKFYVSMHAVRGKEQKPYTDSEYEYGRLLCEAKDECLYGYLKHEYEKAQRVIERLEDGKTPGAAGRLVSFSKEVGLLEEAIKKFEGEGTNGQH